MLEMKITIAATDLAAAINSLAAALANGNNAKPAPKVAAPAASAPVAQPTTPTVPINPTPAPVTQPTAAPATTPPTAYPTAPGQGAPLSATPAQTATPIVPTIPVVQPVPVIAPAVNTTPVPTSAPQYTLDMIATAGSALIDAGKMGQLMGLLEKFSVASLTELSPSSYGAFATELRALGAAI